MSAALAAWRRAALGLGPVNGRLLLLLAALVLVFGLLLGDQLFSAASLRSMAYQLPELGILSLAMMIPLLSGGLDLSIIATADLCALAMAWILTHLVPASGAGYVLWQVIAIAAGFVLAGVIGVMNGVVIAYFEVSPILATLGSMTMIKGLSIGLTHGNVISGFPGSIVFIGNGDVFGVPLVMLIFIAIAVPAAILLTRSRFGTVLIMLGSNEAATRYSGIDTRRLLVKVYVASAMLSAAAGVVMMARFNSANATYGESYLLVTILAAVLGGVDPSGGFGKVTGLVIALVILQLISTALNLLGVSEFLTLAIWGGTLLLVAGIARLRERFGSIVSVLRPQGYAD